MQKFLLFLFCTMLIVFIQATGQESPSASPQAPSRESLSASPQEPEQESLSPFDPRENVGVRMRKRDLWNVTMAGGAALPMASRMSFKDSLWGAPAEIDDSTDFRAGYCLQFSGEYGLDHYLVPGISVEFKLDYSAVQMDLDIKATQGGNPAFVFDGDLSTLHIIGLMPMVRCHMFQLIDNLFSVNLPTSWDIYLGVGPRLNLFVVEKGDLKLDDLNTAGFGMEANVGLELFLSTKWALKLEGDWYTNFTNMDFNIKTGSTKALRGDINLQVMKAMLGISYYF